MLISKRVSLGYVFKVSKYDSILKFYVKNKITSRTDTSLITWGALCLAIYAQASIAFNIQSCKHTGKLKPLTTTRIHLVLVNALSNHWSQCSTNHELTCKHEFRSQIRVSSEVKSCFAKIGFWSEFKRVNLL